MKGEAQKPSTHREMMEVCGLWRELEIVTVGHVSPVVCVQPVCAGEDGAEREGLLTQDSEGLAGLALGRCRMLWMVTVAEASACRVTRVGCRGPCVAVGRGTS